MSVHEAAVCAAAIVLMQSVTVAQESPPGAVSPVSFSLTAGFDYFKHSIVTGEDPQNVSYTSNALASVRSETAINLWGTTFVFGTMDRSLTGGGKGEAMLRGITESVSGLEKFTAGVRTDPFVRRYFGGTSGPSRFVRGLMSVRFRYSSELFYSTGLVHEASEYVTDETTVDYTARTSVPSRVLPAGASYEFKTKYSFSEVSFVVWQSSVIPGVKDSRVRLGYALAHFERPTNVSSYTLNGKPLVFFAAYDAKQLSIIFEPADYSAPGFKFEAALSLGVDNKADMPVNFGKLFNPQETAQQYAVKSISVFEINAWFNRYFESADAPRLALTFGFFMKGYGFDLSVVKGDRSEKKISERDYIYQFYCMLRATI